MAHEMRMRLLNAYKKLVSAYPDSTKRPVIETFAELEASIIAGVA